MSIAYLVEHAWGLSNSYLCRLQQKQQKAKEGAATCATIFEPSSTAKTPSKARCVIDDYELAEKLFTTSYLYAVSECRRQGRANLDAVDQKLYHQRFKAAKEKFKTLDDDTRVVWEFQRRAHLSRHATIKDQIICAIKTNPKCSWRSIEQEIDHWCCDATIRRWVISREGYRTYAERIIPALSPEQKRKHLEFAKRFQNNWGLGGGKFLLVHYDEKWFWGLVMRRDAKMCEELGIDAVSYKAYHRSHVSKVMGIAVTAFAFKDSIENGGDGLKIGFYRAQTNKVAKKLVRQAVRQDDGSIKRTGAVIREKGDLYLVDCNVTGSSEGTPDDPKFALKKLFEHHIFQKLDGLVAAGGQYEGYIPVIQGDNAGPHAEKEYFNWCKAQCEQRGWHWEPQAPQMPHMNNLDLSVFPCMSRRHCAAARERGGLHVLKQDEIWDAAEDVWSTLPSSKIASGFVQCSRIASKVIALEGGNDFVGNKIENGIHCDIRKDYNETPTGLSRKDGEMINPPAPATAV
ncbi:unnamed protein product [Cylindrotheca closterium]|uniref:Transposase Tc1-like domain-containing protein n=1 Tax=Cylindrotheca closterium TaxID=2856 RepID=A0AAD2G794_9STRA|nr:unnamed protein product [Cylindrotheca closterium]